MYFSGLRLRKSTGNQKFFWSCWMHAQSSSPIMIATVPPHFCRRNKPSKCLEGSHFLQNFSRKRKNTAPKFTIIDYRYQTWGTASMLNFRAVHNKNSVEWNDHNHVIKKLKLLGLDWLSNSFRYNFPQFIRAQSGLNTNVVSERKTWTTTVGLEWPLSQSRFILFRKFASTLSLQGNLGQISTFHDGNLKPNLEPQEQRRVVRGWLRIPKGSKLCRIEFLT